MTCLVALAALAPSTACVPPPTKGPERALQIVHNRHSERAARIALDDRHVYILDGGLESFGIRRVPRGGGLTETLIREDESGSSPRAIAIDDTSLYFLIQVGETKISDNDEARTRVLRVDKSLEPRLEEITTVDGEPGDLVLIGNDIVFSTLTKSPTIYRVSKQGTSRSEIVELAAESRPVDLLVHEGKLIVADSHHGTVSEVSLAGETRVLAKVEQPLESAAHGGRLSVVAWHGVFEIPSGKQLAHGSRDASFDALAAAPEGLYYKHEKQLRFLPWSGSKPRILQKAQFRIEDVVVAPEGLYYVDSNTVWFRARAGS